MSPESPRVPVLGLGQRVVLSPLLGALRLLVCPGQELIATRSPSHRRTHSQSPPSDPPPALRPAISGHPLLFFVPLGPVTQKAMFHSLGFVPFFSCMCVCMFVWVYAHMEVTEIHMYVRGIFLSVHHHFFIYLLLGQGACTAFIGPRGEVSSASIM